MRAIALAPAASAACAVALGCAATLTARLAAAEISARYGDAPSLQRAAQLDRFAPPAAYFERLADLDPAHAIRWLDAALQSNSRLSPARIERGLAFERSGQLEAAERDLLAAARTDHQYLPAWTLANFYFRRQRSAPFWAWARLAASLHYDDLRPLLALAHSLDPDPGAVIDRLGGGAAIERTDLDYLIQQGRLDQAQQVARLLIAHKMGVDAPRIRDFADRQISAGHAQDALELWNAVEPALDPLRGPALANANFASAPTGAGFDWRLQNVNGLTSSWQPLQLTLALSGFQPESCALLEQVVALAALRPYRFRFEYRTRGLGSPNGLAWDLDGDSGPPLESSASWRPAEAVFARSGRSGVRLARLRLLYRRVPGSVRAPGEIQLRDARMEVL